MGKGSKQTNTVTIPPEVLARYNAVNATAEKAAANPFQKYSDDPNAFVAPVNATQQGGISNITNTAGSYQPYFTQAQGNLGSALSNIDSAQGVGQAYRGASTDLTGNAVSGGQAYNNAATNYAVMGGQAVDPTAVGSAQINSFLSPYLQTVLGSTLANLQQQQGQEQSSIVGDQIRSGAFGGDRGRIAQANLARQQGLATGQVASDILNQGYGQALGAAQQQQGVYLGANQANRAATQSTADRIAGLGQQNYSQLMGGAQQYASLGQQGYDQGLGAASAQAGVAGQQAAMGTQAQQNDIAQGNAQLAAGTVQQQTDQAGKTALFNQFQQERAYPFQTAQFLANIAEGTGALSGNTTNSTGSSGFFSDERLKEDVEVIGKTFDGQKIVKFRYKGQPEKQIGLIAQDVEKHHPDAVGLARGFKTVNYDEATKAAAHKGHYARGGLVPHGYKRYASGGLSFEPWMYPYGAENASGVGGGSGPRGVPLLPQHELKLLQPTIMHNNQSSGLHDLATASDDVSRLVDQGTSIYDFAQKHLKPDQFRPESLKSREDNISDMEKPDIQASEVPDVEIDGYKHGGLARNNYAFGGLPYTDNVQSGYVPDNEDNKTQGTKNMPGGEGGSGPKSGLGAIAGVAKDVGAIAGLASLFSKGGLAGGRKGYADGGFDEDAMARADELQKELEDEPPSDLGPDEPVSKRSDPVAARHPPDNMPPERGLVPAPHRAAPPSDEKDGNWFDRNRNWLIPALKGLGTAASSNQRNPIGALLQGASTAAQSYGDIEKQQAEIANIRANKPLIEASVRGKNIGNTGHEIENFTKSFYTTPSGQRVVFLADGSPISFADYSNMASKPPTLGGVPSDAQARVEKYLSAHSDGPGVPTQAPPVGVPVASIQNPAGKPGESERPGATPTLPQSVKPPLTPPHAPTALGVGYDDKSRESAARERALGFNGGPEFDQAQRTSEEYRKATFGESQAARQNAPYLKDMASTLANLYSKDGFTTAGYAGELRSEATRLANTISRAFGGDEISSADSDAAILRKIATLQAQIGAQAGGQESNASLETIKSVFPGTEMPPDAGAKLAATLLMLNRRALDRGEHYNAYKADANGLASEAAGDFTRTNPDGRYEKETAVLEDLIRNEPGALKALMSGRISRQAMAEKLGKQYGAPPSIVRYFSPRD